METTDVKPASSELYQLALDAAGIGIWDHDLLTNKVTLLGNSYQLFGFVVGESLTPEQLTGRIHPGDLDRTKKKIADSLDPDKRTVYHNEYRIINPHHQGTVRWVRAVGKTYFTEVNTPYRFTGTVQDITAEVKARETQQKLLALVDNSIELMSILENDQKNSYINQAGMEMLGFDSLEQVNQTPISDLHTPEDIAFVQANVLPSVIEKGKWSGMMNVKHLKTGEVFPVYNNTVRIHDQLTGEPIAVGAVMRDMRPEMAARKALEESERNFRNLVMQAPVGICILKGEDFVIEVVNDSFLTISNKSREEILNKSIIDTFPEAVSQGFVAMLRTVRETGKPFFGKEVEVVQERSDGTRTIFVDFTSEPLVEADGTVNRIMDLSIDVTDKVLARRKLQENEEELQRRVAERTAELEKKNRELEEFTYVSSHDLQEPIRKIKMFRELIRENEYPKFSDDSKRYFTKIGESIDRMSNSLKDLLSYAGLDRVEVKETVNLNDIINQAKSDLELLIAEKKAVIAQENLPTIEAVPHQMHQLFYNLLNNAVKFSRADLPPRITIRVKEKETSSNHFTICISDNGIGFSQDKAEKIFTMFQRLHTKDEFEGTGIGLALCKKVVLNHQGTIWAEAEPGRGATFYVRLSLSTDSKN